MGKINFLKNLIGSALITFLSQFPVKAFSQTYSVEQVQAGSATEYRFKYNERHFATAIKNNGAFVIRPRPGDDVNGWGSSLYMQPFLPGATLKHTTLDNIVATDSAISLNTHGKVSRGTSNTYGDWTFSMDFDYNLGERTITGTGNYSITLDNLLSSSTGDLNLYKIASNYLDNVPLLTGETGDTGDMQRANVRGDAFYFQWVPPLQPSHFPQDQTNNLSINVIGDYNNVDTVAQGYARIEPAYKPSLKVILNSNEIGIPMIFGAIYDTNKSQDFWEDNVGITPLILKTSTRTNYNFDVSFKSIPCPEETTTSVENWEVY